MYSLRYRSEIGHAHGQHDIRQFLIYIGKAPLGMQDSLHQTGLDYRYGIVDMHKLDCHELIARDNLDALVLAILCDFKGRPEREVVQYILQRLRQLTADNDSRFREYVRMLEILSTNCSMENIIEEEQKMLSHVDQTRLPSFRIGMQQGMQQGEQKALEKLLTLRFGPLSEDTLVRLRKAELNQLERWIENILDAQSLEDVFDRP